MPKKVVTTQIFESDDEDDKRMRIETTPTPSASEDEVEDDLPRKPVKKVLNDKEPSKSKGRPKKEMTEERKKQLEAMRDAKKRKYDDYKEGQAILFLRERGFKIDDKSVHKELKARKEKKAIHLKSDDKPSPKVSDIKLEPVAPVKSAKATTTVVTTTIKKAKPYNPFSEY